MRGRRGVTRGRTTTPTRRHATDARDTANATTRGRRRADDDDAGVRRGPRRRRSRLIVLSEIGDKTFFIAALMAMKRRRVDVFLGAWSALFAMTALSACAGTATARGAVAGGDENGRRRGCSSRSAREAFGTRCARGDDDDDELRGGRGRTRGTTAKGEEKGDDAVGDVFAEAFAVTFLAEWGDRSQIATVGLAAQSDVAGRRPGRGARARRVHGRGRDRR